MNLSEVKDWVLTQHTNYKVLGLVFWVFKGGCVFCYDNIAGPLAASPTLSLLFNFFIDKGAVRRKLCFSNRKRPRGLHGPVGIVGH